MNFVIDASTALSWCFEDEGGDYAMKVLDALQFDEAVAASLWPLEVTNGLVTAVRKRRLDPAKVATFIRLLLALPIAVDPVSRAHPFESTLALARKHGLTSYDASYLELAVRIGVPVATLDEPLRAAALAEGVGLYRIG